MGRYSRAKRLPEIDSGCRLLIVPLFRGSSRFESWILSHHSRFKVTCEFNNHEIDDDDDDEWESQLLKVNRYESELLTNEQSQPESQKGFFVFFPIFCTLVTGPRRSSSLELSDTRVYEPQMQARLGPTVASQPLRK